MESIKSAYRAMLAKWHPDKCRENREMCNEMTRKIISAHQTIMDYCRQYRYSFSEEALKQQPTPEQWWHEHFGEDPVWGNGRKPD